MARSLKEALLEQLETLRERGLAPRETPREEDEPAIVVAGRWDVEEGEDRRDRHGRTRRPRGGAARADERDLRSRRLPRPQREPREGRARRAEPAPAPEIVAPVSAPAPARSAGQADRLRRRAEQRQHEQRERDQIRQLVEQLRGETADAAFMDRFFASLGEELGALPPLHVVREAIEAAGSTDVAHIGDQVRRYYRRARRPA